MLLCCLPLTIPALVIVASLIYYSMQQLPRVKVSLFLSGLHSEILPNCPLLYETETFPSG